MAWFRARGVARELEARLAAPSGGGACGKAERKWYSDGTGRLKVRVRDLDLPDGTEVSLSVNGHVVAVTTVRSGKLDLDTESENASTVPEAAPGETLAIVYGGEILSSGTFRID